MAETDPAQIVPVKRKKRRWLRIALVLLLIIVLLIIFAPTIASTSPVRSLVVGKINDNLNGTLAVEDWSIGWFSGIDLRGVKIDDAQGRRVLEVARVRVPISLIKAARGNYDLGDTLIDKPNLVSVYVDENGVSNLEKLAKRSPSAPPRKAAKAQATPPPSQQMILPNVRGNLTINELRGTITAAGMPAPLFIDPSSVIVKISDLKSRIQNEIKLVFHIGDAPAGTITVAGNVDANKRAADEKLDLANVALAGLQPFMPKLKLTGIANGSLQVKADESKAASADGAIAITDFSASGEALKGDTFATSKIDVPVKISRGADGSIKFDALRIEIPQFNTSLEVVGHATEDALANVATNKPPGAEGNLAITLDGKDLPGIANQLRNTLGLQKDVQLTRGALLLQSNLTLAKDSATAKQKLDLAAAGTNKGQPVTLDPVHLDFDTTAIGSGGAIPDLRNLRVALDSEFATLTGGGESLGNLDVRGGFDLAKLRQQLGQFLDMGDVQLAGTGNLVLTSKGDITKSDQPIEATANVTMNNVVVSGIKDQPNLEQSHLVLSSAATLIRGAETFIKNIAKANVTLMTGDEKSPVVDVAANAANVSPDGKKIESFQLAKLNVNDLPTAQKQFGAFVPALKDLTINSGQLYTAAAGAYDGKSVTLSKPMEISIRNLGLTRGGVDVLRRENIAASFDAAISMGSGVSGVAVKSGKITSSFANVTLGESRVRLEKQGDSKVSPTVWEMLESVKLDATIPDLPRAYALYSAFNEPAPQSKTGQPTTQPLEITSGAATLSAQITRDDKIAATHITIPQMRATKLILARGNASCPFDRPVDLKVAADVVAGEKIQQVNLTQLGGDAGIATIEMPQAIVIKGIDTEKYDANGKIKLAGAIGPLTKLLAVIQGGEPMPYGGDYVVAENVATTGGKLNLVGDITANKFTVTQNGKPVFSDNVVVKNNLVADMNAKSADIKTLSIDMPSSEALGVKIAGSLASWDKNRDLKNFACDLSGDWEKIWPLVKPMLSPKQQESYKDLKIAGKFQRKINVGGSYPAFDKDGNKLAFNQSIKSLTADGGIGVERLQTSGLDIAYRDLPFELKNGVASTVYANKPKAERVPKPGTCNGGTIDLGSVALDLSADTPRLSIGKNQQLLKDVQLNPVLADTLGKFAAFLFKDSSQASGLVNVTVVECKNIPLSDVIQRDTHGQAKVVVAIKDLRLDGPIPRVIGQVAQLGGEGIIGEVRDSSITYGNGQTNSDLAIFLTRKKEQIPLRFTGGIGLANLDLRDAVLNIPPQLLGRKDLVSAFPQGMQIPITGTTEHYKIADIGKILQQNLGGVIGGIISGNKKDNASTSPSGDNKQDLGGLLQDVLGGKSKEDQPPKKKPKKPAQ